MKPEKNTKKAKKNNQAVNKFLKKKKLKKEKKLLSYADTNLEKINELLNQHRPDDAEELQQTISKFMNSMLQGEACSLKFPAHMGAGLASLLLNNMSYWLGNTQETLKTAQVIKKLS